MSQHEIYIILKDLGGIATTKTIKLISLEKFPNATLYTYVRNRLNKLKKNGFVIDTVNDIGEVEWKIIEEWPF